MLSLNNINSTSGSRKSSKRLGRGNGSGKGTFCARGCKGQNSRAGGGVPDWFEGGQTPLFRRMPKLKGFSNSKFKKDINIINLSDLELLAEKGIIDINREILIENNLIRKKTLSIKLLGNGEVKNKFNISVDSISISAKNAIEKAGGTVKLK